MPFIGNAGQFSNIYEKNYETTTLRVVEGDAAYQAYNPADSHYKLITNLQEITDTGNVTSNTLQFSNAITGFTTTSNVGIANPTPTHTLDVGSKAYIDENDSNTFWTSGTLYADKVLSEITEITNSVTTREVLADKFFPKTNGFIEVTSNVGVLNTAPVHTLDIGANVQIDEYGSNTFWTSGNIYSEHYKGPNVTVSGSVDTDQLIVNDINSKDTDFVNFTSNVGVLNTAPVHTLDIGANVQIDEYGSNTFWTSGNVYSEHYKGSNVTVSGSVDTDQLIVNDINSKDTDFVNFTSNVGVLNTAPVHTLDIGANVQIDEYGSNTFWTSGNVYANVYTGAEIQLSGVIRATEFILTGGSQATPTPDIQAISEVLASGGGVPFSSDRTLTLSNVTTALDATVIQALTVNSNLIGNNVTAVTVNSNLIGNNVTAVTVNSNLIGNNVTAVTVNSNLIGNNVTAVTVNSNLIGNNVTAVTVNSNLIGNNVTAVTVNSNLIGNNVTAVTVNSNVIAGNVTVDNNLIVNTDDLVVDTVNSRVGINKASPAKDLDVTGEIECSSHLTVGGDISGNGDAVFRKYTIASPGSGQYSVIGPGFDTATVNPTLTLMRGQKYVFDNTVHNNGHPLEIRDGNGGSAYTDGVSGGGTATITFTVPMDAPIKLYYQCINHPAMGNIIYIPLDSIDTTMALNLSNNLVVNTDDLVVDTVNSKVGIGTGAPAYTLDVAGDINLSGDFYQGGSLFVSSLWTSGNDSLYYTTNNVGIGTNTAEYTLDVHGNANVGALTTTSVSGDGSALYGIQSSNVSDFASNVTRITNLETSNGHIWSNLESNVTTLRSEMASNTVTLRGDLQSNVTTLRSEMASNTVALRGDLQSNVTTLRDTAITFTGIKTFQNDVILESNLRVQGDLLVANTVNMTVSDPILELGSNNQNTGDIGLVMTRHGTSNSNVAVFFDETADALKLGYTLNGANDTTLELDSNALAVSVQGALTAASVSGDGSGLTSLNASNISSGTINKDRLPTTLNNTTIGSLAVGTNDVTLTGKQNYHGLKIIKAFDHPDEPATLLLAGDGDTGDDIAFEIRGNGIGSDVDTTTTRDSDDTTFGILHTGHTYIGYPNLNPGETGGNAQNGDPMLNVSGDIYATGNVGIGTDSPDTIFHTQSNVGANNAWVDQWKHVFDANWNFRFSQQHNVGSSVPFGFKQRWNGGEYSPITFRGSTMELSGNVGIGTTSPGYKLDVHGSSNVGALTATSVSGDGSGLTSLNASNLASGTVPSARLSLAASDIPNLDATKITSGTITVDVDTSTVTIDDYLIHDGDTNTKVGFPANDTFTVTTANSERLRVDSSGNVGIGTTSPGYKLHVSGDIYATGNVTAYSDVRKKKNLEIIERPIEKIEKLNGYTYEIDDKRYTGLVAQEVLKVLPEAVVGSEEKGYGLAYGNMAGLFVEAMKELKSENHSLKAQLASVLARLDALENP
jgi:hypothetical protein